MKFAHAVMFKFQDDVESNFHPRGDPVTFVQACLNAGIF